jgi:hypothetical protein
MIGPLEIVGDEDSAVCVDGVCVVPDAAVESEGDQARGFRR